MSNVDPLRKKLQNAFKLSGFIVRSELCKLIIEKLKEENVNLQDKQIFDTFLKNLCNSLESQCLSEKSIEKEHILQAIEVCLHSGYDKHESIFNVISAFDFPKLTYDPDRKLYLPALTKPKLLPYANSKSQLFIDRYTAIYQRTLRSFKKKLLGDDEKLELQTVDYLLSISQVTLERTLILGSLLLVSEGKFYLEDPSGIVQLDLTYAKYHSGFFVENCFVLVNGDYEDKILHVATIILPPGEEYKESRPSFGNLNYFGGSALTPLRDSVRLTEHLMHDPYGAFFFFSDVWLDYPQVFEKLEILFEGMQANPPIAFIFMGNFMRDTFGSERMENLRKLFKQFGELASHYNTLINNSHFVFLPGMEDPCMSHIVPRLPLPTYITNELKKYIPNAVFTTNPCRIQYCTKEIVIFRADILAKLMQGTIHKPKKENIAECVTRTIISQGHLSPMSLNALPVHWDYDYTLHLYPLPDLVVIGDKSESYEGKFRGCQVVNPGSFCESSFQFKSYIPFKDSLDDCVL